MIKSIEEQAREYVESKICFNGLEYSVGGNTYNECFRSFLVGAKARDAQFLAVVNELKKALDFDYEYFAAKQHRCIDLLKLQKEVLTKADQMLKEMKL